ncbi:leucine rich repeat (LRR) protein [Chryseobacterium sp. 7]|uniref:leucine-rich repeat domain-containing protein n=1 Tax=Chryseobacterium sp. 7 TaxID=2035214 RepID=UPI000EAFFBB5|nr:leucine-rich repeat domain-containing protein [Chryseobacterium sp. 7]RLJ32455.1 leucine rich repeat (LRR) protein [Chryseobacterium sp. 7]
MAKKIDNGVNKFDQTAMSTDYKKILSFELGNDENWRGNAVSLPEDIIEYTNITCLEIGYNKIEHLSADIFRNFGKLLEVYFNHNRISEIPTSIGLLKKLEILTINNNPIKHIPHELTECISLESFAANHCELESLPKELGNLKSLEVLLLNDNHLSSLPETIGKLNQLYRLELKNNKLKYLPDSFSNLTSLKQLDLRGNYIDTIYLEKLKKKLPKCEIKQ